MKQKQRYEVMVDGMFYAGVNRQGLVTYSVASGKQYSDRGHAEKVADHIGGIVVIVGNWKRDW